MSQNLLDLAVTQFSTNLVLKTQQTTSKLRGRVAEGTHKGKQASPVQYAGPIKMKRPEGRFAPKGRVDTVFERRWVYPIDSEIDQMIDSFDELRTISDPRSAYSTNAASAVAREWDDTLIAAATGAATLGVNIDSLTTENFDDTTYGIAADYGASAATGATVTKLRELKRKLRHYADDGNPDNEQVTLMIGSQQESDLLGEVQVVSLDYNERPVLKDGNITRFLGMDIVISERLKVASNVRTALAILKSGLYLGVWKDMANSAAIRYDLSSHPWDLNTQMSCGATRLEKGKLFVVKCADTTGASITP